MHCRICDLDIPDNQLKFDRLGKSEPCKECLDSIADLDYCNPNNEKIQSDDEIVDIVFVETDIDEIIGSEVFIEEFDYDPE